MRFFSRLSFKEEPEKIPQELVQAVPSEDKLLMCLLLEESTKLSTLSAKDPEKPASDLTRAWPFSRQGLRQPGWDVRRGGGGSEVKNH